MTTILNSRSGADSRLRLVIPVNRPDREFQVEVTVREPSEFALTANYFDVLGSIQDDTFARPPQGKLPMVADFE